MTQPPADIAFANFRLGPIDSPAAAIVHSEAHPEETVSYSVPDDVSDALSEAYTPAAEAPLYESEEAVASVEWVDAAEAAEDLAPALAVYTDEPAVAEVADASPVSTLDDTEDYPVVAAAPAEYTATDDVYSDMYKNVYDDMYGEAPAESEPQPYAVMSNTEEESPLYTSEYAAMEADSATMAESPLYTDSTVFGSEPLVSTITVITRGIILKVRLILSWFFIS